MRQRLYILYIPILSLISTAVVLFFPFSAEDAFITYRYAQNLATLGSFVFNEGEPIMALTSPFHGLFTSLLFVLTGKTILANKIVSGVLFVGSAVLVCLRYRKQPTLQLITASLVLLPPCVALWTFGGLETPYLMFLVTSLTLLVARESETRRDLLYGTFLLAGLAFVTRFDSILFTAPLLIRMMCRTRRRYDIVLAIAVGAALPVAWMVISHSYYGDIFPTSFYAKSPSWSIPVIIGNGKYILFYLTVVGIIPAVAFTIVRLRKSRRMLELLQRHIMVMWWLYCGVAAELLYGLTMATTHMMFSFRFFVPYIPAVAILIADLVERSLRSGHLQTDRSFTRSFVALILGLVLLQGAQVYYTYGVSINGLSPWGEYPSVGIRQYARFIETLGDQADDIREHWNTVPEGMDRRPRIFTYAAGVVPYTFQDSYVYETLVSYRHCYQGRPLIQAPNVWMRTDIDLRLSADYIHMITPRHGRIAPQLPLPEDNYSLISSYVIEFDGYPERFLVFFNSEPEPHRLTHTIDGLCSTGGWAEPGN